MVILQTAAGSAVGSCNDMLAQSGAASHNDGSLRLSDTDLPVNCLAYIMDCQIIQNLCHTCVGIYLYQGIMGARHTWIGIRYIFVTHKYFLL